MPTTGNNRFIVRGGSPLRGEVRLQGAKNAALPMLAAALLTDEPVRLANVPRLQDTLDLGRFLKLLGVSVRREGDRVTVSSGTLRKTTAPPEFENRTRHSLLTLGPLLARFGEAEISFPAGCPIGNRKFDLHLEGLRRMGAEIELLANRIRGRCGRLRGIEFEFYYPSFSGTLNLAFAAALASGRTVLRNAARNPEVDDALGLLIAMGARIAGRGTGVLKIEGVPRLRGVEHRVMPDRIELFSLLVASALTRGSIFIAEGDLKLIAAEAAALEKAGVTPEQRRGGVCLRPPKEIGACDVATAAYPGFHTDNQPLFCALMTLASGTSAVRETILDNRFAFAGGLARMGARIAVKTGKFRCVNGMPGQVAVIEGVKELKGAEVRAGDIRGGAALLISALAARGETAIADAYQVERGYQDWHLKLASLGAVIEKERA